MKKIRNKHLSLLYYGLGVILCLLWSNALQAQVTETFNYTGAVETWTVPAGVTSLTIKAEGAQGGSTPSSEPGGLGAVMTGTFTVTPGATLNILVGQQGGMGSSSNGGGGSFVTDAGNNPLIVAGGGGGITFGITPLPTINANTTTNGNNGNSALGNSPNRF